MPDNILTIRASYYYPFLQVGSHALDSLPIVRRHTPPERLLRKTRIHSNEAFLIRRLVSTKPDPSAILQNSRFSVIAHSGSTLCSAVKLRLSSLCFPARPS